MRKQVHWQEVKSTPMFAWGKKCAIMHTVISDFPPRVGLSFRQTSWVGGQAIPQLTCKPVHKPILLHTGTQGATYLKWRHPPHSEVCWRGRRNIARSCQFFWRRQIHPILGLLSKFRCGHLATTEFGRIKFKFLFSFHLFLGRPKGRWSCWKIKSRGLFRI